MSPYRYLLTRRIGGDLPLLLTPTNGILLFVMLNPSTADETSDDATIRRCKGFATDWGYGQLEVVNLFALRATSPRRLLDDPRAAVGPENDGHVSDAIHRAHRIVCAWGAWGAHDRLRFRVAETNQMLHGAPWCHLGLTDDGEPRHPLRLARTTPWQASQ
jgi:hypothetical protein